MVEWELCMHKITSATCGKHIRIIEMSIQITRISVSCDHVLPPLVCIHWFNCHMIIQPTFSFVQKSTGHYIIIIMSSQPFYIVQRTIICKIPTYFTVLATNYSSVHKFLLVRWHNNDNGFLSFQLLPTTVQIMYSLYLCHRAFVSYLLSIMDVLRVVKTRLALGFRKTPTDEND